MVAAGGQMVCGKAPGKVKGWMIAVNGTEEQEEGDPRMLAIAENSVSTSGDLYQFVNIGGKKYSHILNPKTGIGLTTRKTVTVIAPDGTTADWLSTACSVMKTKKALRLIGKIKGTAILITEKKKQGVEKTESRSFQISLLLDIFPAENKLVVTIDNSLYHVLINDFS